MLDRFVKLLKSMFNKGLTKMETPELLAEQAEMALEADSKKITAAFTESLSSEKLFERQIKNSSDELSQWEKRALLAVQQNNDDLARTCLAKKQELSQSLAMFETQLVEQKKASALLKARSAELQDKLREFRAKKTEMMARMSAGKAISRVNELTSGSGAGSMDSWEQKIMQKESQNEAMREISGYSKSSEQVKNLDMKAELDEELASLKASMGAGPRLVEAHEVVDDNLPAVVEESHRDEDKEKN